LITILILCLTGTIALMVKDYNVLKKQIAGESIRKLELIPKNIIFILLIISMPVFVATGGLAGFLWDKIPTDIWHILNFFVFPLIALIILIMAIIVLRDRKKPNARIIILKYQITVDIFILFSSFFTIAFLSQYIAIIIFGYHE